ncbi:hypothetical protein ACRTDU_03850 [Sunxiuqinia elliptica]
MKKLILFIFLLLSFGAFAQFKGGHKVEATNELIANDKFIWQGDDIYKDSLTYAELTKDSIRFKYINGSWTNWFLRHDSMTVDPNSTHLAEILYPQVLDLSQLDSRLTDDESWLASLDGMVYALYDSIDNHNTRLISLENKEYPTDLNYISSPASGTVVSSSGINATIPLVDGTNAGLMPPGDKLKLSETEETWVLVGHGNATNTVKYTNDLTTFIPANISFSIEGYGVAFNGEMWLAGGVLGTNNIMYSYDGKTWQWANSAFTSGCRGFAWNGSMWIALGYGTYTIATSTDGINWTGIANSPFSNTGYKAIWDGSKFVAVGRGSNSIAYSSNGTNWTGLGTSIFGTYGNDIFFNGSRYVAVGNGTNDIAYSDDGINWNVATSSPFTSQGVGVAYGNGIWLASGAGTYTTAYSPDGVNWTGGKTTGDVGTGVTFAKDGFIVGFLTADSFEFTPDGINWTNLFDPIVGGGRYSAYAGASSYFLTEITGNESVFDGWDKNEADNFDGDYASLINKPALATVATSGNYTDLSGRPSIPSTFDNLTDGTTNKAYTATEKTKLAGISSGAEVNVNADWNASSGDAQILNKPTLSTVATSGNYTDLSGRPSIPSTFDNLTDGTTNKAYTATEKTKLAGISSGAEVNVNADWNASSGDAQILNKPALATVATSGSYTDLSGRPSIPSTFDNLTDGTNNKAYTATEKTKLAGISSGAEVNVNADWNASSGDAQILNKPTLSTVATSGNYTDLSGRPSIPSTFDNLTDGTTNKAYTATEKTKLAGISSGAEVNVNADWNASSGDAQILNKPALATVATSGSYTDLSGRPSIPSTFDNLTDGTNNKAYTATEKTKLAGISSGAEVNVNADWNASSGDAQILNKPTTLPAPDSSISYSKLSSDLKGRITDNDGAWSFSSAGIIEASVSSNTTVSFANLQENKALKIHLTISAGAVISWPAYCQIIGDELGDGTFKVYADCWNSSAGAEDILITVTAE